MPTYDYRCLSCDHRFSDFAPITAPPLSSCPACKAANPLRLIGAGSGVIFKGSGFFCNDYRKKGEPKSEG